MRFDSRPLIENVDYAELRTEDFFGKSGCLGRRKSSLLSEENTGKIKANRWLKARKK
jgi:hypothetical protein